MTFSRFFRFACAAAIAGAASLHAQNPATAAPLGPPTAQSPTVQSPTVQSPTVDPLAPVRLNRSNETVLTPRISAITRIANTMPHYLTGVGLVTGLPNTGSSDKGTRQAILNYIRQHELNLTLADVVGGTTALVSLTCSLPPFAKQGTQLDVKVSVLGDAQSLRGGELMRAELQGVDGKAYVVAMGALTVAGFTAKGQNAQVQKNPNASAHLLNGGLVIREEQSSYYSASGALELRLINPSPFNSRSVANGIRTALRDHHVQVHPVDSAMVRIEVPDEDRSNEYALELLGLLNAVRVPVENPAKVTIDQVSGIVLAGEGVLISPCVVGVSDLTIAIVEEDFVSQPNPLAQGSTERVGRTRVEAETTNSELQPIGGGGATVADLLQNLKPLDLTPAQLVQVFAALDQGGFLHATLEVR